MPNDVLRTEVRHSAEVLECAQLAWANRMRDSLPPLEVRVSIMTAARAICTWGLADQSGRDLCLAIEWRATGGSSLHTAEGVTVSSSPNPFATQDDNLRPFERPT